MNDSNVFFDCLPEDWKVSKVGACCQKPEYGLTESAIADEIGPKFLRITDITENGVHWDTVPYCRCPQDIFPKYELKENDILFARIGATTGKSYIAKKPPQAVFASYLIRLRPSNDVIPDYLYYFFNSDEYWNQVNANKSNNLKGGVNSSILADIRFPLPPKKEQQKIATVLFKIQQAIEIQEAIIEKTRELKKTTLQHAFTHGLREEKLKGTEIGLMPESWTLKEVGSILKLSSGKTRPEKISNNKTSDLPYPVYGGNGIMGYSAEFFVSDKVLIIGRVGEYCGAVHVSSEPTWISDNALYSKEWMAVNVSLAYLAEYLRFFDLNRMKRKSSQPLISQSIVQELKVPIPSETEQKEIANILKTIGQKIDLHAAKESALQDLFKAMLNKLMTGEIRVKDLDIDVSEVSA